MSAIKNGQLENAQLGIERTVNKDSNSELIEKIEVEGTPFQIVNTNGEVFGVLGQYRLTEPLESVEEAQAILSNFDWNRLVQVTMILIENLKETSINELIKEQ